MIVNKLRGGLQLAAVKVGQTVSLWQGRSHATVGAPPFLFFLFLVFDVIHVILCHLYILTYLPHKAVAEVSKDKEPIGRECAEFNWFESQLMSDSNELRVK